jgi:osmotically-inducible protein OsmY
VTPEVRPNADAELAARVKKALEEASSEIAQGIDVAAANGVVRLYGTVASRAARSAAEKIAASAAPGSAVENKLIVLKGS